MKKFTVPNYQFFPGVVGGGSVKTNIPGFNIKKLVAIINQTRGILIYSTANADLRYYSVTGSTVFLNYDTSAMDSTDYLQIIYEADDKFEVETPAIGSPEDDFPNKVIAVGGEDYDGKLHQLKTDQEGNLLTKIAAGGLATEETLDEINTKASSTNSLLSDIDGFNASMLAYDSASYSTLNAINAKLNSLGQKTMANSMPVTLASDQGNVSSLISSVNVGTMIALARHQFSDQASSTLALGSNTLSLTSTAVYPTISPSIQVTAIVGTPTYDLAVWATQDSGVSWKHIYSFPRITATGTYMIPNLLITGNGYRFVETLGGPFGSTLTRNIVTQRTHAVVPTSRQFIERTLNTNLLNSVTTALWVEGTDKIQMEVLVTSGAAMPVISLEGSSDNTNWYDLATTITPVAGVAKITAIKEQMCSWIRAKVTTAGTTSALDYLCLKAMA